jgi:Acetoacetate decarboxylase (ADC)
MPPRYGKLAVSEWAPSAPVINGYRTEPWKLDRARVLEFRYEIDDAPADTLLPPALHPAMPAYATFVVMDLPDTPVGAFRLGEVRIVGRAGGRPAAFVVACFCDSETARQQLSARWGYPARGADIKLAARHFDVTAQVTSNGHPLLELELRNRRPLPALHFQPLPSMNLARNREDGKLVLVQVDTEAVFESSDGGSEKIVRIDSNAFPGASNLRLMSPMSATCATADLTLAKIQLICDPEVPAESGITYLD